MEYNCFTTLCYFLLYNNVNQLYIYIYVSVTQLCPTLCDSADCSSPGSSVYGLLQARILEWVAISISRGSSWPRYQIQTSLTGGRFFTVWAMWECSLPLNLSPTACPPPSYTSRSSQSTKLSSLRYTAASYFLRTILNL